MKVFVNDIIRLHNGHYYAHISTKLPKKLKPVLDFATPPPGYRKLQNPPRNVMKGRSSEMVTLYREINLKPNGRKQNMLFTHKFTCVD